PVSLPGGSFFLSGAGLSNIHQRGECGASVRLRNATFRLPHAPARDTHAAMNRPYIGIITRAGLESLRPELEQTARSEACRAYLTRPLKAGCWWCALSDATAAEVIGHISRGDRRAALVAIDRSEAFLGPIFPGTFPMS